MSTTVTLNASAIGGVIQTQNSGPITVPANGLISVDSRDVPTLLAAGAAYVNSRLSWFTTGAARAASAGRIVASGSLSNGTLAIANQPDFPRQLALRVDPGTVSLSAGNVALSYVANDGSTQVDNLSAIATASAPTTQNTTKGVVTLNSVIVTGVTGGATPLVQVNDTNSLSVPVDPGFVNFSVFKEYDASTATTVGTVGTLAASVIPTGTPNSTLTFTFGSTYSASDV